MSQQNVMMHYNNDMHGLTFKDYNYLDQNYRIQQ